MIIDSGLSQNLDNWRDCYYRKRLPKEMSHSTANIQMQNLEREVLKIRAEGFCAGYTRKERTLNAFDIGSNFKGHTVLIPTTHLSKIILENTFNERLALPKIPDGAFERAQEENTALKAKIFEMENQIDKFKEEISNLEDTRREVQAVESVLDFQRQITQRITAQRDEAQILLVKLCERFGLICEIDNHGIGVLGPEKTKKRKGRKNRKSLIEYYTFGDFDKPIEDSYIKDLTTEGIEPNPGPVTQFAMYFTLLIAFLYINSLCHYTYYFYPDVIVTIIKLLQYQFALLFSFLTVPIVNSTIYSNSTIST